MEEGTCYSQDILNKATTSLSVRMVVIFESPLCGHFRTELSITIGLCPVMVECSAAPHQDQVVCISSQITLS